MPKILTKIIHECAECTNRSQTKDSDGIYTCDLKDKHIYAPTIPAWCPLEDLPYQLTKFDQSFITTYRGLVDTNDDPLKPDYLEGLIKVYHDKGKDAAPNWFVERYHLWQTALSAGSQHES